MISDLEKKITDLNNRISNIQPVLIYKGNLGGGFHTIIASGVVKRYIEVYARTVKQQLLHYTIDTEKMDNKGRCWGSAIGIANDESSGLDYYVSESYYTPSDRTFYHNRTGFFRINGGYTDRNGFDTTQDQYGVYEITTHD